MSFSFPLAVTGDTLRSEKNYSIVVFEKLSQAGIELGMDIVRSLDSLILK